MIRRSPSDLARVQAAQAKLEKISDATGGHGVEPLWLDEAERWRWDARCPMLSTSIAAIPTPKPSSTTPAPTPSSTPPGATGWSNDRPTRRRPRPKGAIHDRRLHALRSDRTDARGRADARTQRSHDQSAPAARSRDANTSPLVIERSAAKALTRMSPKVATAILAALRSVASDPFAPQRNVKRLKDRTFPRNRPLERQGR